MSLWKALEQSKKGEGRGGRKVRLKQGIMSGEVDPRGMKVETLHISFSRTLPHSPVPRSAQTKGLRGPLSRTNALGMIHSEDVLRLGGSPLPSSLAVPS